MPYHPTLRNRCSLISLEGNILLTILFDPLVCGDGDVHIGNGNDYPDGDNADAQLTCSFEPNFPHVPERKCVNLYEADEFTIWLPRYKSFSKEIKAITSKKLWSIVIENEVTCIQVAQSEPVDALSVPQMRMHETFHSDVLKHTIMLTQDVEYEEDGDEAHVPFVRDDPNEPVFHTVYFEVTGPNENDEPVALSVQNGSFQKLFLEQLQW